MARVSGGTGDVSPQLMSAINTMPSANTANEIRIPLPISRFTVKNTTRVVVLEVLKVYWNLPRVDANNAVGGDNIVSTGQLSTVAGLGIALNDPRTLVYADKQDRGSFTAGGTYQSVQVDPVIVDMTDGAGHGVLIGVDSLFFTVSTLGFSAAANFGVKLLYRFKEVGLQEYIGIVQQQSSA